jgi:hypothetical protein
MSKFTPGPWTFRRSECGDKHIWIEHNESGVLATVFNGYGTNTGDEANAALISAAPDLLEALKSCLKELGQTRELLFHNNIEGPVQFKCREVISKAEREKS